MKDMDLLLAGVDAGATKTRAIAVALPSGKIAHLEGDGASATVRGPAAAAGTIVSLLHRLVESPRLRGAGRLAAVAAGVAGAWPPRIRSRVAAAVRAAFPGSRVAVRNDAVAVLHGLSPGSPALLLTAGTGAFLAGTGGRRPVRVDGWGPLAGDAGSGVWISRRALAAALAAHDGREVPRPFARAALRAAGLRDPGNDIHRLYSRPLPPLAPLVARFARRGDPLARRILGAASRELARTVAAGLKRMPPGRVTLFVTGGLAAGVPEVLADIRRMARRDPRRLVLAPGRIVPELACLKLAARIAGCAPLPREVLPRLERSRPRLVRPAALPPTERENPATALFSRLPARDQVELLNTEDARVAPAVRRIAPALSRAVVAIERRMRAGGRLLYVGAGTSGRLGILDASEVRPTFGVSPGMVRGIIAGGKRAITSPVERAEDSAAAGRAAVRRLRVTARDAVVALSASGTTPYAVAALAAARRRGAAAIAVTSVPRSPLAAAAAIALVPETGPEAIAGSTRLKAGTAQKLILNTLSTCVMARLGRVTGNLMSGVVPGSAKLRRRAARIAAALAARR